MALDILSVDIVFVPGAGYHIEHVERYAALKKIPFLSKTAEPQLRKRIRIRNGLITH